MYGMQVDVIGLYSEQKGRLDIDVKEMYFYEDDKELTFDNPYQTEDNEAYMEYKSNLEKFIKTQVQDGYEEDFEAFLEVLGIDVSEEFKKRGYNYENFIPGRFYY